MEDWKQEISDKLLYAKNALEDLEQYCNDSFDRMPEVQRINSEAIVLSIATEAKDAYVKLDEYSNIF